MTTTALDEVKILFNNLKMEIEDLVTRKLATANQVHTLNGLSDISKNLGLIRAGEFRAGNNKEPGYGFSGVRIAYPAMSYEDQEWNIVGADSDRLQFGISASDGKAVFSGGSARLDENGLSSDTYSKIVTYNNQIGANVVTGWLGGVSQFDYSVFGIVVTYNPTAAELVDDFESGDLSAWTVVGNCSIYEESATTDGLYSCKLSNSASSISANVTVGSTNQTSKIKLKAKSLSSSTTEISAQVTGVGGAVFTLSSSWQEFEILFRGTGGGSLPLVISCTTGGPLLVDDIYFESATNYSLIGAGADGPESFYLDAASGITMSHMGNAIFSVGGVNERATLHTSMDLTNQGTGNSSRIYMKDTKFIIRYDDAGTVRWKYLDLSGTGTTWTHTTVEP